MSLDTPPNDAERRSASRQSSRKDGRAQDPVDRERVYVRRIERRFLGLRESGFYLSSKDFMLLLDWHGRGVPAEIVIRAIEEVFARAAAANGTRKILSITYCRHAVEEAWEERRTALLGPPAAGARSGVDGNSASFSRLEILDHLDRAAQDTIAAASSLERDRPGSVDHGMELRSVADRLTGWRNDFAEGRLIDLEKLEDDLVALENRALDLAGSILTPAEMTRLHEDVEVGLAGFAARMSERARTATVRRALASALRRRLQLPRYSLLTLVR